MTTATPNPVQPGTGAATPAQPLQTDDQALTGQSAETTQETPAPQFVTKDDLAQFGNQLAKQLKQSARDRDNRIEQQVNDLKVTIEKSGIQVTAQQELALRNQIAEQLETEDAAPEQVNQPGTNADELVNQFVTESLAPFGVTLNPNSPHFPALQTAITANFNNPNPAAVNKAIIEYGKKEAERIANQQTNADARVIGSGGGPASPLESPEVSGHALFQRAHKK